MKKNKDANKEIDLAWQEFLAEMERLRREQNKIIKDFEKKLISVKREEILKKINQFVSYIFIDESGQFVKRDGEQYFVVSSFMVGNPRRIEKRFRSWCRLKFPRKLRYQSEIKFSEVKINDSLRIRTLKYIANLDVRVQFVYLDRKNIPIEYWKKNKL